MGREWVLKSGMLIAMSVYTYLRLIVDHGTPNLQPLRQKEVDFCTSMIREKVRALVDAWGLGSGAYDLGVWGPGAGAQDLWPRARVLGPRARVLGPRGRDLGPMA